MFVLPHVLWYFVNDALKEEKCSWKSFKDAEYFTVQSHGMLLSDHDLGMFVTVLGDFTSNTWLLCASLAALKLEGETQTYSDPPLSVVSHQLVPAQLSKAIPAYSLSTPLK